jgi:mono/diheme cytochrome c family protein
MMVGLLAVGGCAGGEKVTDSGAAQDGPTWHADVAPIVAGHCGSCHTEGGVAPFTFDDYASAKPMAEAMLASIESGSMPPWYAVETDECGPMLPFKGDLRLSDEDKQTLAAWVAAGAPEGDASSPAALPEPLFIEDPDAELFFAEPHRVEGDEDEFICFVLDPGIDTMKWVTEIQLAPGNEKVDHHALVTQDVNGGSAEWEEKFDCFNIPSVDGFLMATWTPGAVPLKTPEGSTMPLYPDARIIVQMHYHPSLDGAEFDQSSVQIKWQDEEPEWAAAQALVGNDPDQNSDGTGLQPGPNDPEEGPAFVIPAGAQGHTETIFYTQTFPMELPLFSVGTHMHYVGTDMKVDFIDNDGDSGGGESCMIQTPWDFDWQRVYSFDAPVSELPVIGPGDSLRMRCTYDNSMDNPAVARALAEAGLAEPVDVWLGEETLDEMCLGLFGILIPPSLVGELF